MVKWESVGQILDNRISSSRLFLREFQVNNAGSTSKEESIHGDAKGASVVSGLDACGKSGSGDGRAA
jgi:hypothetical protein